MKNLEEEIKDLRRRRVQWPSFVIGLLLGISLPSILLVLGFNWLGLVVMATASAIAAKLLYNRLPLDGETADVEIIEK